MSARARCVWSSNLFGGVESLAFSLGACVNIYTRLPLRPMASSTHPTQHASQSHAKHARSLGVIVYLTQGARHSSYGQSTVEQLRKSVALLYEHYNAKQRDDVLFLHTGDVDTSMQQRVLELCGEEASFFEIDKQHFRLPSGVDPTSKEWLFPKKFSEGYRHMIRFFTVCLWEVVAPMGYQFVMRLDDDAYILSPIPYNIFAFMAGRNIEYAFRLTSYESGEPAAPRTHRVSERLRCGQGRGWWGAFARAGLAGGSGGNPGGGEHVTNPLEGEEPHWVARPGAGAPGCRTARRRSRARCPTWGWR